MIDLFKAATRNLEPTWHNRYREICEMVRGVNDWCDPADANDNLINRLIYDTDNGVSSVGMAFTGWPNPRPGVNSYRELLAQLKHGLSARYPADEVARCREMFRQLTNGRGAPSIFNRILSAFCPGKVSPVMFENDFNDACAKLVQGGYITEVRMRIGEDSWYSKNVQLMEQLRRLLPDGHCEGADMDIDDYSRGMFVWGVHYNINMNDWIILREVKRRAKSVAKE